MSIYYFAISNNESIVCHHAIANRSFENVVYDYLKRHPSDQVMRFNQGNVYFICVTVSEISFVAAADQSACKQSEDLVSEVSQHFLSDSIRLKTAKCGAKGCLQNSYGPVLEQFMLRGKSSKKNSSLDQLHSNVSGVVNLMKENAKIALERGDKLDTLVSKTDDLAVHANQFQVTATKVSRKTCLENFRLKIIIIVVVAVLLLIIVVVILWQTGLLSPKPQH